MDRQLTCDTQDGSADLIKQIKLTFESYDDDKSGELDKCEMRHFQDDLRLSLSLTKCDNRIFNRIFKILDGDRSGTVEFRELVNNLDTVIPILCEPGEEMEKFIKMIFRDFDIDGSGYLEKKEIKLQCDIQSDKMGVERCKDWQVDYIISIMDVDHNGKIDVEELMYQYSIINREISKNKKKKIKRKQAQNIFPTTFSTFQKSNMGYLDIVTNESIRFIKNSLRARKGKPIQESEPILLSDSGDSEVEGDNLIKKPKYAERQAHDLFTEELKRIYLIYDEDQSGELDEDEIKDFLDDVRVSLSLTKTTPDIHKRIMYILDEDQGGTVDFEEFEKNIHVIVPILCEIGEEMIELITKIFHDFDVDKSGFLDKKELKLILDLHCDKMEVHRCTTEQLTKIFSDLELDEIPFINLEELLNCYPIINQHISKNKKKVFKQRQSVMQSELNPLEMHKVCATGLNSLTKHAIAYIRKIKLRDQQEAKKILEDPEARLDEINMGSKEKMKEMVPLPNLLNKPDINKTLLNKPDIHKNSVMRKMSTQQCTGRANKLGVSAGDSMKIKIVSDSTKMTGKIDAMDLLASQKGRKVKNDTSGLNFLEDSEIKRKDSQITGKELNQNYRLLVNQNSYQKSPEKLREKKSTEYMLNQDQKDIQKTFNKQDTIPGYDFQYLQNYNEEIQKEKEKKKYNKDNQDTEPNMNEQSVEQTESSVDQESERNIDTGNDIPDMVKTNNHCLSPSILKRALTKQKTSDLQSQIPLHGQARVNSTINPGLTLSKTIPFGVPTPIIVAFGDSTPKKVAFGESTPKNPGQGDFFAQQIMENPSHFKENSLIKKIDSQKVMKQKKYHQASKSVSNIKSQEYSTDTPIKQDGSSTTRHNIRIIKDISNFNKIQTQPYKKTKTIELVENGNNFNKAHANSEEGNICQEENQHKVLIETTNQYLKISRKAKQEQYNFFTHFTQKEVNYIFRNVKEQKMQYEKNLRKLNYFINGGYKYLVSKVNEVKSPKKTNPKEKKKLDKEDNEEDSCCSLDYYGEQAGYEELRVFVKELFQPLEMNLDDLNSLVSGERRSLKNLKEESPTKNFMVEKLTKNLNSERTPMPLIAKKAKTTTCLEQLTLEPQGPLKKEDIYYTAGKKKNIQNDNKLPKSQVIEINANLMGYYKSEEEKKNHLPAIANSFFASKVTIADRNYNYKDHFGNFSMVPNSTKAKPDSSHMFNIGTHGESSNYGKGSGSLAPYDLKHIPNTKKVEDLRVNRYFFYDNRKQEKEYKRDFKVY